MKSTYVRHLVTRKQGANRAARRKAEAQARHKADTPHGLGKRKSRGWRLARKRRRKAQKLARR